MNAIREIRDTPSLECDTGSILEKINWDEYLLLLVLS
jgi:hypothetical protein